MRSRPALLMSALAVQGGRPSCCLSTWFCTCAGCWRRPGVHPWSNTPVSTCAGAWWPNTPIATRAEQGGQKHQFQHALEHNRSQGWRQRLEWSRVHTRTHTGHACGRHKTHSTITLDMCVSITRLTRKSHWTCMWAAQDSLKNHTVDTRRTHTGHACRQHKTTGSSYNSFHV